MTTTTTILQHQRVIDSHLNVLANKDESNDDFQHSTGDTERRGQCLFKRMNANEVEGVSHCSNDASRISSSLLSKWDGTLSEMASSLNRSETPHSVTGSGV